MKRDSEDRVRGPEVGLSDRTEQHPVDHVVFDFTGLEQPDVCDLSMILTARLQSAPTDSVWVRSLPWQTARILRLMKLDHLFRHYPTAPDEMN